MTYLEALKEFENNAQHLSPDKLRSATPHNILGRIVAPEDSSAELLDTIANECINEHVSNEDVLMKLNLFSNKLHPFIVFRLYGKNTIIPLASYLENKSLVDTKPS